MKFLRPEITFFLLALTFGSCFLAVTPPFQVPDEGFHLFRAWRISEGKFGEEIQNEQVRMEVPTSLVHFLQSFIPIIFHPNKKITTAQILQFRNIPLDPQITEPFLFASTSPHPPFPYLPQVLAVLFGKAFQLSPFSLFYLGRCFNFLTWVFLVFFAIRIIPIYPWLLTLLALSPMSLHQAASLSPDAVINGLAFLVIAQFLSWLLREEKAVKGGKLYITVLESLWLALSKLVYLGHSLFFILLPSRIFRSRSRRLLTLLLIVGVNGLAFYLLFLNTGFTARAMTKIQSEWLWQHPFTYIEILAKTLGKLGFRLAAQFVGSFGHLDTPLPNLLAALYWGSLIGVALWERGPGRKLRIFEKGFFLLVALLEILGVVTAIFLTYSHPGYWIIDGIQGRYFIPVAPLLFLSLFRPNKKNHPPPQSKIALFSLCVILMTLTVSLVVLKRRFYLAA